MTVRDRERVKMRMKVRTNMRVTVRERMIVSVGKDENDSGLCIYLCISRIICIYLQDYHMCILNMHM